MNDSSKSDHGAADRTAIANDNPDVQRGPVGTGKGYSGHEYDANDHAIDKALHAATAHSGDADAANDEEAIPPDNGKRAFFERATGEVRGSGVGTGGGAEGEDLASDSAAGDGYPITGGKPKP
jgi:hypothetical protein